MGFFQCRVLLSQRRSIAYTRGMAKSRTLHAVDYLRAPEKHPPRPICAVFGDEPFLRRQVLLRLREAVLGGDEGDFSYSAFEGRRTELRDVLDELSTMAMFGGDRRLVVVEEGDEFVTRYRPELEDYCGRPSTTGVLVLDLKSFPGNTRLYKAIAADGLLVDCKAPAAVALGRWAVDWARRAHRVELPEGSADMLLEMIGPEMGLLDQEIAKLALSAGPENRITPELIQQSVGGWRAKTAWEMLDATLAGDVRGAMTQLDRLLAAGEAPIGVLGQISASLRRFAAATRLVLQAEAAGRKVALRPILEQAGFRSFVLQKAQRQLLHLGRERGQELYDQLLQADLDLKGASSLPPRVVLEQLIVRLAVPKGNRQGTAG